MARGPDGLDAFLGTWQAQRQIRDRVGGQVITGVGSARFAPDAAGRLIYDEELVLDVPGQSAITGTRRYLWHGVGQSVQVLFADGTPFHALRLEDQFSADTHHCAPDLYEGRYDFSQWPQWEARWRVSGPRKDYLMVTTFNR